MVAAQAIAHASQAIAYAAASDVKLAHTAQAIARTAQHKLWLIQLSSYIGSDSSGYSSRV